MRTYFAILSEESKSCQKEGVIQVSNAAHGADKMQAEKWSWGMTDNMVIGDVSKSSFYVIGGVKD